MPGSVMAFGMIWWSRSMNAIATRAEMNTSTVPV